MSFPLVYWGPDGEQYSTYADPATGGEPRYRLGQQLVLRDGRKFRFARAGGVALVVGNVLQAAANIANHVDVAVQAATKVNDNTIPVTLGATAVAQDEYMDGTMHITGTPDVGRTYTIAEHHAAVTSAGTFSVPLGAGVTVQTAHTTGSFASLIHHPYRNVIQAPVTTLTQMLTGVACSATAINNWGWVQTRGQATVVTSGTLILGNPIQAVTAAGSASPWLTPNAMIGTVMQVSAKADSPVYLQIDG